jgi:hypothetical protein
MNKGGGNSQATIGELGFGVSGSPNAFGITGTLPIVIGKILAHDISVIGFTKRPLHVPVAP